MKRIKIKKFRNKLLFSFTLVFAVPVLAIGFLSYNKASISIETEVKRYTAQVILQTSNSIDTLVLELNRMALVINSDEEVLNILRKDTVVDEKEQIADYFKLQKTIQNTIGFRPDIDGFTIFSTDGRDFSMNGKSVKLGYDFTKEDWYTCLKRNNSYFQGSHTQRHVIDSNAEDVVSLSKVIKDTTNHRTLGYLLIDCNTKAFENIFGARERAENSSMFIVGDSERLIYGSKYKVCNYEDIKNYIHSLKPSDDVATINIQIHNTKMIFSYYTSPYTGLKIIHIIPESEIRKNIRNIGNYTVMIMFGSGIAAFLLSLFIALSITEPVKKLIQKMSLIQRGNFKVSVDITSEDEIGELGKNFDKMAEELDLMINKVYEAELTKQKAEICALQAQINPHFLYNTLAVIDSMAIIEGNENVSSMCRALSGMLRYNVETNEDTTLQKEVEQIQYYLFIQKFRYGERFHYSIQMDENLSHCKVIKLLVQPVIENAIIHGVEGKRGHVSIEVFITANDENNIEIIIADSGSGIKPEVLEKIQKDLMGAEENYWKREEKFHLGLRNIKYRIALKYGQSYGLSITSTPQKGTTVKLVIPKVE